MFINTIVIKIEYTNENICGLTPMEEKTTEVRIRNKISRYLDLQQCTKRKAVAVPDISVHINATLCNPASGSAPNKPYPS